MTSCAWRGLVAAAAATALVLLIGSSAPAATDLVPEGATWQYWKGETPPPDGWKEIGFDASAWASGPAGIGFGDGDDATVLGDMRNGYIAIFARRELAIADPKGVRTLTLRIRYDDAFVAYLNGVEVLRRGLGDADNAVPFDWPAGEDHEATEFETLDFIGGVPLLVAGTNVLAFQVHNRRLNDSDLSFHPNMIANAEPIRESLPAGFSVATIAAGFRSPVGVAFAPDGRLFVAEKRGEVWIVKDGLKLPSPFLSLDEEVQDGGDRGLLGLALDPEFASNGHVYVLYVVDPTPGSPDEPSESAAIGRLARYTAAGDAADPESRLVLLGRTSADGFLHCHSSHSVGSLKFAADGTLFVSAGDGGHFDFTDGGQDVTAFDPQCAALFGAEGDTGSLRAQGLDVLAGKVLRIDPATGLGLPGNPFFSGDPAAPRSRVWAYGLRNPYRFDIRPDTGPQGTLYVCDVGWNTWEELNVAKGGENFGWPCFEGRFAQSSYASDPNTAASCGGLSSDAVTEPIIAWNHKEPGTRGFIGNCASGTAFYTGAGYPPEYAGACFFTDYGQNWLRIARVDADDHFLGSEDFGTGLKQPVDLEVEPTSGDLVYVAIETGQVRRIRFTGPNRPPLVSASADPTAGLAPLLVQFSSTGTFDPDEDAITFEWDFGDASAASFEENPSHLYNASGKFVATLTVTDAQGSAVTAQVAIDTTNSPPRVAIERPAEGERFYGGERIVLRATAADLEDGDALQFYWEVRLHHEEHVHPEWFVSAEREPMFVPVSHGDDGNAFYYEVVAAVTDSGGLAAQSSVDLRPGEILRGDGNGDGRVDISDPVSLLQYLFLGREVSCAFALDADASQSLEITDSIYVLEHLFLGGPGPRPPYPDCGVALNSAALPCSAGCP